MRILLTILSSLLILSCSREQETDNQYTLTESDAVIKINVSSDINLYERCLRHYEDESGEYITLTRELPKEVYDEIVFFNLKKLQESHSIKVYKDGPNAVNGGLFGYDIINMDSIVLTSRYRPILYYIDNDGIIKKEVALRLKKGETESLMLSMVNQPYVVKDGIVDFPQNVPYTRNFNVPNPEDFKFGDCPLS